MSNFTQAVSKKKELTNLRKIQGYFKIHDEIGVFALAPLPWVIEHASSSRDKPSPVDFREAAHQVRDGTFLQEISKADYV